jgi:hypothetical protein
LFIGLVGISAPAGAAPPAVLHVHHLAQAQNGLPYAYKWVDAVRPGVCAGTDISGWTPYAPASARERPGTAHATGGPRSGSLTVGIRRGSSSAFGRARTP